MQWYEPSGYSDWQYNKKGGMPKISRLAFAFLVLSSCVVSYNTLSLEYRLEYQINVLELFAGLTSGGYLSIHLFAWLNSKFDFITTVVEVQDTCIYRFNENSNEINEPEIYLNEIQSCEFELINWRQHEFYNCHMKLKPMRSKRRDYFEFGIQKGFFEKNRESLISKFSGSVPVEKLMSAPIKD